MGRRKAQKRGHAPKGREALPPGAYGTAPPKPDESGQAEDLGVLGPIFAWFEGGDQIQFGNLCPLCPPETNKECRLWRMDTLDGVAAPKPRQRRDCPFFIKWNMEVPAREKLTPEELDEGKRSLSTCVFCHKETMATVIRTSSEFGTRQNPRMVTFQWCDCGLFSAVTRELCGVRERCVFCGLPAADADSTVFGGAFYHLDCFLRLRFFFTMGEMLRVAQGYAVTGKALSVEESEMALRKTLQMVHAFRVTGNHRVLGVNRVIHWLQGDSPIVTERTVLRSRDELLRHLGSIFKDDSEHSVGVHILEDAYIVYENANDVRWITHGSYKPVKGVDRFVETYVDAARRGDWKSIDRHLLKDIPDGKCALCGALTRSHRVAVGEDEKNVYVCHPCWTGQQAAGSRE